jgi:hypothetical protein
MIEGVGAHDAKVHVEFDKVWVPRLSGFEITNEEEAARMNYLYPKTGSQTLITLNCEVRNEIKRQHPDPS